ncbi:MAG: metallophosphoesterase [bacterium]
MHIYAIGDIHGHLDLLQQAHDLIRADQAQNGAAPIVHIGDLVDRGQASQGVIEYLQSGVAAGQDWLVIKGNHDRLFTQFLNDMSWQDPGLRPDMSYLHFKIGGATTLESYGVKNAADRPVARVHAEAAALVPAAHRAFLQSLPTNLRRDECFFVHAGIRPGVPLDAQAEDDLVWIRKPFLEDKSDHGALIVHGHTVIDRATHYGNRLNIDSGAAYGGPLSAVVIEGRNAFLLTQKGRVKLKPVA